MDTTKVKSLILSNLKDVHTLTDIASRVGVSTETLRKDFVRHEGISIKEFVNHARVEAAESLLQETDLRCFEVAYQVGFTREDVAARTFKAVTGVTMNEYRDTLLSRQNSIE